MHCVLLRTRRTACIISCFSLPSLNVMGMFRTLRRSGETKKLGLRSFIFMSSMPLLRRCWS